MLKCFSPSHNSVVALPARPVWMTVFDVADVKAVAGGGFARSTSICQ